MGHLGSCTSAAGRALLRRGRTGKSIIELQKNVAHVAGKDWLGSLPEPGPAFYIGTEDDTDEIHIRLAAICKHYDVTFKEIIDAGLKVLPMLGKDATLCASTGRSGKVETTALYRQLYEAAGDIRPRNISVDTLSRAFSGSEIDRSQVYAFAMHMQALAAVADGAVTVLAHPSLSGMASGTGLSGSTAWHGAFRFRQYLTSAKHDDDDDTDTDLRELQFKKNQYGPLGEKVVLRYDGGLFLPERSLSGIEKVAAEQNVDRSFLELLRRADGQGRKLSHQKTSHNYAPAVFALECPEIKKSHFEAALLRLFNSGKIRVATYGRPSQPCSKIEET